MFKLEMICKAVVLELHWSQTFLSKLGLSLIKFKQDDRECDYFDRYWPLVTILGI